jgi:enediyne biosynthesis protein E4
MGVDFRDYDNDGRDDLFITALSNETFPLFRNLGGRFGDVTYPSGIGKTSLPWSGWSCGMFDFNNDGHKDVFTANGHVMDNEELTSNRKSRQPNVVFLNQGDGRFRMQLLPGEAMHRGAAFGDFDRDGRIDAVVTRLNEKPIVLRNVSEGGGHWIALRLDGTRSNRWNRGAGASGDGVRRAMEPRGNLRRIRWLKRPASTLRIRFGSGGRVDRDRMALRRPADPAQFGAGSLL